MTGKTSIEWTAMPGYRGAVWNPTTGCTRVSAGCDQCYAFSLHDKRYATNLKAAESAVAAGWTPVGSEPTPRGRHAIEWARVFAPKALPWPKQYDLPFSRVQLLPERLDAPLRTRTPTCYFVDSMSDLFHEDVPDAFLDRVFGTMESERVEHHRFLILTKRPERMARYMRNVVGSGSPKNNIWLGTSVEDQASFDERMPHLRATPAAVRFLSCEPLLGPLDTQYSSWKGAWEPIDRSPVHWLIVGGESGPRARPMDLTWVRSLRSQCQSAGDVAFFMKQLGSNPVGRTMGFTKVDNGFAGEWTTAPLKLRESHGRNPEEWPEDLRIREWPR
jgi:protein gp37